MDFLDPKKKRANAIRLIIGYCLVAVALILATVLLLFASLGYGINRTTGEVTQNGLVFVDAHPEQATIFLNGQEKGQTDGRYVVEAGNYKLELRRDGYRNWQRDFVVEGGTIVRLVYPFMFPSKLVSTDVLPVATAPDLVTESPDRHWVVTHSPDTLTTFQIIDTSTRQNVATPIVVPDSVFGAHTGAQKLELTEWSTDNRHLLLKHSYEGGYDYIIVDRADSASSLSVGKLLGRTPTSVTLRDKQADKIYTYDEVGGVLQTVSLKDKSVAPVATHVLAFWPYKDTDILYITDQGASAGKVNVHFKDSQGNYIIRELLVGPKYLLNIAEFDGNTYLTVGSTTDGKVYIYKNPQVSPKRNTPALNIPLLLLKLDNPDAVTFSANARFIAVQAGSKFEVYDAETKQQYRYDTNLQLDPAQKATWMDGHRLMLISGGKLNVFDYDGLNKQSLVNASSAFVPLFDHDYNAMYSFGPSTADATKSVLSRTELKVVKR